MKCLRPGPCLPQVIPGFSDKPIVKARQRTTGPVTDQWTDEMDELTREFLIESQEGLDRMERCLTELESRPDDTGLLADIFRSVHTIKGTTGFLGFTRLEKLAHAGENLLTLLRDGKLAAGGEVITGLLQLLDGLRSILKLIESQGNEGDGTDPGID